MAKAKEKKAAPVTDDKLAATVRAGMKRLNRSVTEEEITKAVGTARKSK